MKRNYIALLIHPYKNRLLPRTVLKESIDRFVRNMLALVSEFPHFRFNLVLPAYILECVNPLLLSQLRDLQKKGYFEWILTGYTEPFLSLSPPQLTNDNIRYGLQKYTEIAGETPVGFMPPFSNFEPSMIEIIKNNDLQYLVVSKDLLPQPLQSSGGYWMAEHSGSSMPLIATTVIRHLSAPVDFKNYIEKIYASDKSESSSEKIATIQYQFPIKEEGESDPFRWLRFTASEIDKHILNYQPITFSELLSSTLPLGLQYIPASLMMGARDQVDLHFLNYLHSFDQIGILQRKLMDLYNKVISIPDSKISFPMKRKLFFIQDINRFLPGKECGFENATDRLWTFSGMIDIEKDINERDHNSNSGGQIRITDFLRNGSKSIILSNKSIKLYVDYSSGGSIFEFDYRDRRINLCAAYNPVPHVRPDIFVSGKSRSWFQDRIFSTEVSGTDFLSGRAQDCGNFLKGQFTYKVSKNAAGIRTSLVRQGSFIRGEKLCPLSLEKVFGLEQNTSKLSFVYQLTNQSLAQYNFRFSTELGFCLPGLHTGDVRIVNGSTVYEKIGLDYIQMTGTLRWYIEDRACGLRILFQTQKPLDVWCLPSLQADQSVDPQNGITIILSSPVLLDQSSHWKLIGKLSCKRMRKIAGDNDVL